MAVLAVGSPAVVAGGEPPNAGAPRLAPGQPNPFRGETVLGFALPSRAPVTLRIYDLLGQPVTTLVDQVLDPGRHTAVWDGRDQAGRPMASGLYTCRLQAGQSAQARALMRLR